LRTIRLHFDTYAMIVLKPALLLPSSKASERFPLSRSVDLQRNLRSSAARDARHESQRAGAVLKGETSLLRAAFEFSPGGWDLADAQWLTYSELRRSICLSRKKISNETRHQDHNQGKSQNQSFHTMALSSSH
jgi:hypothetical protein